MAKTLQTIKVFIEPEDEALFLKVKNEQGITLQFQYSKAIKLYADIIRQQLNVKGGQNG